MKKILLIQNNYPGFINSFDEKYDQRGWSYKQVKKQWDNEWFGQGNFYSLNLEGCGWEGREVIINSRLLQRTWAKEQGLGIQISEPGFYQRIPESIKNLLGLRSWVKRVLLAQIEEYRPDVVYNHDLSLLTTRDIRFIKDRGIKVIGQIACPLPINQRPLKEYDLLISSFPHYVKLFRSWGVNSEYLRWCFEDSILKEIKAENRTYGTVFIGGFGAAHSEGNDSLEALARKVKVDFWGYGANNLPSGSAIRKNYHGEAWGREMYRIMNRARIVVNRHINVAGNVANNMRMFDATGMGALLITDDKPNMEEFFKVGKEAVTYKSKEDLVNKVKYYLEHEDEAREIAQAGQKRTLKEHTYKVRMKELAAILDKYAV